MTTHDHRLVAQCAEAQASDPHAVTCDCDGCRVLRGEATRYPRAFVEGVPLTPTYYDIEHPDRRTIVGRVVRWARATLDRDYVRGGVFYVEVRQESGRLMPWMRNSGRTVEAGCKAAAERCALECSAAESRALASTA
jgi:hypothetical protein